MLISRSEKSTEGYDKLTVSQPTPVTGALSIRLKYPGPPAPESNDSSDGSNGNSSGSETSKVPVEWLDRILETSATVRDDEVQAKTRDNEQTSCSARSNPNAKVFVYVPDDKDHSKPWPKHAYPDLHMALVDICRRLQPYYAPFATFTHTTCAVQLFPPDFVKPNINKFGNTTFFDMQDVLNSLLCINYPASNTGYDKDSDDTATLTEGRTLSTITETSDDTLDATAAEIMRLQAYDLDFLRSDVGFSTGLPVINPCPESSPDLAATPYGFSQETFSTLDSDVTEDELYGFYP